MSRVTILGGAGFIGGNLIRSLAGQDLTVFDNFSTGLPHHVPDNVRTIRGDIRDIDAIDAAVIRADCVIHLAAFGSVVDSVASPRENFDINANGTVNVLEACRRNGVGRVIFASTGGALIGNAEPPVNELSLPKPISPYGASKLCGEAYCHAFAKAYGLKTIALRFANVYGPLSGHKKGAITRFMKCLLTGEPISIYGDGSATRDYLFVDDLCRGIVKATTAEIEAGEVFHLASGVETSVKELAALVCKAAGEPSHPVDYLPHRPGEVERNFASFEKARAQLGFQPDLTLRDGLRRTWDWFKANQHQILGGH